MRKRYLSILVACAMLLTSAPTAAFAEESIPADTTVAEEVTTGNDIDAEDITPAGDNSAATEQVQPGEAISDEAAENPADEVEMIADEEQSVENASELEIAEEAGEEFVDGTGLISEIEVVEDESVAKTIEANVDGTIELDGDSEPVTLNEGEVNYTFDAQNSGPCLMVISNYDDDSGDTEVRYNISSSQCWGSFWGEDIKLIYCTKGNNTITFSKEYEEYENEEIKFSVALKSVKTTTLNPGDSKDIEEGECVVYGFNPRVSGNYTMYMEGEDSWEYSNYITLYDFAQNNLPNDSNPLTWELTAGKTYYYLVKGYGNQPASACTMHFVQTPTITGASLVAPPTKRQYEKGTDLYTNVNGMKVNLTFSDGSSKVIECVYDDGLEIWEDRWEDIYGNHINFTTYGVDIKGNIDYGSSLDDNIDDYPSGIYYMGADVYTYIGNRRVLFTRITVPFTIVDKGQHIHLWGAWTNTATGQSRKCELCGATETKSTPVLELTANKLTMKKGQTTKKFKVTKMIAGDSLVSVKSSDKKTLKVSNVKPDGTFKLKALKVTGKKKVKLTITLASGLSKTIKVTIQNAKVKTTKVKTDKKLTLQAKKKAKLKSVITPVTSQDKVKYKSSNKKVATVNAKGVVTAKKPGKAKITIQSGNKKATCTVTVQKK